MLVKEFHGTRKDGVKLYLTIDAAVNENGKPVRDAEGKLVPTGFKIKQVETGRPLDHAVDVEGAPYTYVETDQAIEVNKAKTAENV